MYTKWSQPPDGPLPMRDVMAALYWETMYNDGNDTNMYPCPGQTSNVTGISKVKTGNSIVSQSFTFLLIHDI